jgi:hypothetical protein
MPGRNAQRGGAIEQRPGCFQVAVRTAEEQQRSIGPNGFFRFDHIRFVAFGAALARLLWVSAAKRKRLTIFCMLSRRRETRGIRKGLLTDELFDGVASTKKLTGKVDIENRAPLKCPNVSRNRSADHVWLTQEAALGHCAGHKAGSLSKHR